MLEIATFNVHVIWCLIEFSWNFFCFPYLHAFLCFHSSQHMIVGAIWNIWLCTLLLVVVSHHLLKVAIIGSCWCLIPNAFPMLFHMKMAASLLLKTCWTVSTYIEEQQEHLEIMLVPNLQIASSNGNLFFLNSPSYKIHFEGDKIMPDFCLWKHSSISCI